MSVLRLAGNSVLSEIGTHLQIVLDTGSEEYEIEVQRGATWQVKGYQAVENHKNSSNYGVEGSYAITTLEIGSRDADNVWELLKQAAHDFDVMHFDYYNATYPWEYNQNSNTFAYSMLLTTGIDANDYTGVVQTGGLLTGMFDIRDQVTFTIKGTAGADWFYAGAKNDALGGGGGDDILSGGGGADKIAGGADRDELKGGDGADVILTGKIGGSATFEDNDEAENIEGGDGTDYIAISAGSGKLVELQGGDSGDRLIIYKEMLTGNLASDDKHPAFALMGGVFGVVSSSNTWTDNSNLHDPDANVFTDDETGQEYRRYN